MPQPPSTVYTTYSRTYVTPKTVVEDSSSGSDGDGGSDGSDGSASTGSSISEGEKEKKVKEVGCAEMKRRKTSTTMDKRE